MAGNFKRKGGEYSPGTYNINSVIIDDVENTKWLISELNIYEDLLSPVMTGDMTIVDTHNLLSNLPIIEGSIIKIDLSCNSDDKAQATVDGGEIKGQFEVIKIKNRSKTKDNQQVYTIKFSSVGWSNNVRSRISRSYIQMSYSDIVEDIYNSKFTGDLVGLDPFGDIEQKKIDVEPTDGTFNVIIPRWKPITCFSWLAGRSRKGEARNFLFWEDKEKFHFKSIESLMGEDPVAEYSVVIKNTENVGESAYYAISEYQYMDTGEVLYYGLEGMFGNRMIIHDICDKKLFDYFPTGQEGDNYILKDQFDYQTMFENTTHTDGEGLPLINKDITDTFSESPGNARLTVIPSHYKQWDETKNFEYDKWVRERISQKATLKYLKIRVWAVGIFKRKVGDIIKFNMPSPEYDNTSAKNDPRLQGNYLITSLRHKFDVDKHIICMELLKDNIYKSEEE